VKDKAIDKGIGKRQESSVFGGRLLTSVKDRHPFKEELANSQSKWTNIEGGIQSTETVKQLSPLPSLPEDPSVVGCCRLKNSRYQLLP